MRARQLSKMTIKVPPPGKAIQGSGETKVCFSWEFAGLVPVQLLVNWDPDHQVFRTDNDPLFGLAFFLVAEERLRAQEHFDITSGKPNNSERPPAIVVSSVNSQRRRLQRFSFCLTGILVLRPNSTTIFCFKLRKILCCFVLRFSCFA